MTTEEKEIKDTPRTASTGDGAGRAQNAPEQPERTSGRRKGLIIVFLVGVIIAVGAFVFWRHSSTYESTDDAQVDGHLNAISTRIQGVVNAVYIDENQFVKAGEVVATLDPRDYEIAVEQARAQLSQSQAQIQAENPNIAVTETASQTTISTTQSDVTNAQASVAGAERDHAAALARLREAEANSAKAQADVERYRMLVDKDEIPRQQYDQAVANAKAQAATVDANRASAQAAQNVVEQRRAQVEQARSRLVQANQNAPQQLAISRANVRSRQATAQVANTQVERALLDLSYCKIVAPISGVVTKRTVEVGNHVQPGQQLFMISQIDDLWVTANFKENQLRQMRPGQPASVKVDAFNQTFDAYLESMPGATGTITSLLPPENATGNYVKVVQRLPVRIRFKKGQPGLERLRPGMSVVPKIWLQ